MSNLGNYLRNHTVVRFVISGVVNTLFGFMIYSGAILTGSAVWIALLAGTVSGTAFNFLTTGGYVFRDLSFKRFPRFAIVYFSIYFVNLCSIAVLAKWIDNPIKVQAIILIPMASGSYFLMKQFVFRANK